jgi:metal-responsive CopG/Arc/MetJ family transcriptional regulator
MSKGSERVTIRIPDDLLARMRERIRTRNAVTRSTEWEDSEYIRYCIECDLRHAARSRFHSKARRKTPAPAPEPPRELPPEQTAV